MKCKICKSESRLKLSNLTYLGKYQGQIFRCVNCDYLQVSPANWLEEAYSESISLTDTGLIARNQLFTKRIAVFLSIKHMRLRLPLLFLRVFKNIIKRIYLKNSIRYTKKILDFGGGYGVLVRMLRDFGLHAEWRDPYTKNVFARGFEASETEYDCLLSFEVLEHLEDPSAEFDKLFNQHKPNFFIFSTLLYGREVPESHWWYYTPETGQHIGFFNEITLKFLAKKYGYHYISIDMNFHIFSKSKLDEKTIRFFVLRADYFFPSVTKSYASLTLDDSQSIIDDLRREKV